MVFTAIDATVLRMAAWPVATGAGDEPDLPEGQVPQWREWLGEVWADRAFAGAVESASPDLARRVREVCAGRERRTRQVRSATMSVLRYRLRASSRATPFGLFAGVAPAVFGSATTVRIGEAHRVTDRVNSLWLATMVTNLERCSELATRIPVVTNNAATIRDDRLVIGLRPEPGLAEVRREPAEVSIWHTRAVDLVLRAASTPIARGELADRLAAMFPTTAAPVIVRMLDHLVEQRVMVSSLRAPMTVTDPLGHLLSTLDDLGARDIPAAAGLLAQLPDRPGGLTGSERTAGDLRVDADVVLPATVAGEAARAAAVLARLTPHPFGRPAWLDYHARFLERYGSGAAVPLLELVDPDCGLGFPSGYRASVLERPVSRASDRDSALLRLAQTAALRRDLDIVLDDATIADLQAGDLTRAQWSPHTELAVQIHAGSRAALDRGEFMLIVSGVFRAAGTTAGRFLDLFDRSHRERMISAYAGLPAVGEGALRVQISCPPLYTDTETVARSPQVLSELVSISEHRPVSEAVLGPEDLSVIADAHRFMLWSRSLARLVEPELFSAVEFANFAHPLLRMLCELPTARTAACCPFSWGLAGELPFLPRLTYRRTIISPARWNVVAAELAAATASWTEWTSSVTAWRDRMMVPTRVYLGSNDQRLQLDLSRPAHLYLLRSHVDRHGHAVIHEAPAPGAFGWLDGHAHEIVVPLATTAACTWPPSAPTTPVSAIAAGEEHMPGAGRWLMCKLYGRPELHSTLLSRHLPHLLRTLGELTSWWFLPYRDPDHHLRLRLRVDDTESLGHVVEHVGRWAADLRRRGLIATMQLDTYRPELGRFGPGAAMRAAETVFAADSAVAIAQRSHLAGPGSTDTHALTAASLLDLATGFTAGPAEAAAWLIDTISTDPVSAIDREIYDHALLLADPRDGPAAVQSLLGGDEIAAAWKQRRTALAAYRTALSTEAPAPSTVLDSLLHLHCVRVHGIAPWSERVSHRLVRAAAIRLRARIR